MGPPPESSAGAPRMKAVILAAGEGARMGPFTASVPKVMIPLGNRPRLEYVVQALAENGVRDLIFVVGYRRERIQSHFQDGKAFGSHITYVTQTKQLGTAHGIWEARGHLEDPFIVLNGSNMVDGRFVEDLLAASKPAVLITQSERPQSYGVVTVDGKELVAITEKPAEVISNLINTGAYALDARIFDEIERLAKDGKHDLPSAVSALVKRVSVGAIPTEGTWVDALYPWDLLRLNAAALKTTAERRAGTIEPAVTIRERRPGVRDRIRRRRAGGLPGRLRAGRREHRGHVAFRPPDRRAHRRRRRDRERRERRRRDGRERAGSRGIRRQAPRHDPLGCGGPVDVRDRRVCGPPRRPPDPPRRTQAFGIPRLRQCRRRDCRQRAPGREGQGIHREPRGATPAVEGLNRLRPHALGDPRGAVEGERPSARRLHRQDRLGPQRDHRELREFAGEAAGPGSHVREPDGHGEPGPPHRIVLRRRPREGDPKGARRHSRVVRRPGGARGRTGQGDRREERESPRHRPRPGRELPRLGRARVVAIHGPGGVRDGPGDGRHHAERSVNQGLRGSRRESRAAADHLVSRGRREGRLRALHAQGDSRSPAGDPRDPPRPARESRGGWIPL